MINLHRLNNILLALIVLTSATVIVTPFAPAVISWWTTNNTDTVPRLQATVDAWNAPNASYPTDTTNRLIVPAIGLDETIYQAAYGRRYQALDAGIWRNPRSSTPDMGGNTVLAGHRFTYTNPKGVFYNLNRLQVGDTIGVQWQSEHYRYQVASIRTVEANETGIEAPTTDNRLTLFTCTPLWKPTQRLVVVATRVTT